MPRSSRTMCGNICHDIVVGVLVWFGHAFEGERWEQTGFRCGVLRGD